MDKPKMTVIGFGRMGRKYAEFFVDGFDVWVSSRRNVEKEVGSIGARCVHDLDEAIASSDYIFIAVPIHALDSVIARINQKVQPDAWAFDMCSARVVAGQKMASLKCNWFGWHWFLFGDVPPAFSEYLERNGHPIEHIAPDEHDKGNSVVALVHFVGMAVESVLTREELGILEGSPAARNLLNLIQHLRNNAPETYWESQICNGFTGQQRQRLIGAMADYAKKLDEGRFPFCDRLADIEY